MSVNYGASRDFNVNNVRLGGIMNAPDIINIKDQDRFTSFNVGPSQDWFYFTSGAFIGDDATTTVSNNVLNINPTPQAFTKTVAQSTAGGLDHVKFLVYRNNTFEAPTDGSELVYEVELSAKQTFDTPEAPAALQGDITNLQDDIRICGGAVNGIDFTTLMVFDVFLSNDTIYAFYERLPFNEPNWFTAPDPTLNTYRAFSHAIPIGKRASNTGSSLAIQDPLDDFVNVSMAYNRKQGYVRWLINGEEKFRVDRIGVGLDRKFRILDHGGPDEIVSPESLSFGFGLFTLLDMNNPNLPSYIDSGITTSDTPLVQIGTPGQYINPRTMTDYTGATYDTPISFVDGASAANNRIFGQGMQMKIKKWRVYTSKERINTENKLTNQFFNYD